MNTSSDPTQPDAGTPTPRSQSIWDALFSVLKEYDRKKVYFSDVANVCYSAKCETEKLERELAAMTAERDSLRVIFNSAAIDRDAHHAMCTRIWSALGEVDPEKVHEIPCDVQLANQRDALHQQNEALRRDGERLRGALESIAGSAGYMNIDEAITYAQRVLDAARAAQQAEGKQA